MQFPFLLHLYHIYPNNMYKRLENVCIETFTFFKDSIRVTQIGTCKNIQDTVADLAALFTWALSGIRQIKKSDLTNFLKDFYVLE